MNTWGLIDTINSVSVFFLLLFALFLLTHKKGKPVSNRTLGLFLLATALALLNFVLSRPGRLPPSFLPVFMFMNAFDFLLGPLLYLYVRSVVFRDFIWRRNHLFHALPLCFYLVSLAVQALVAPASLENIDALRQSFFGSVGMRVFTSLIDAQLLAYLGASLLVLRSYRKRISESYSSLDKVSLSWLYLVIGGFGLIWIIGAVIYLAAIGTRSGKPSLGLSVVNMLITFGIATVIIFRGLRQPEIFSGIEEKPKYEKSPLTDEEADRLLTSLKNYMDTRKPHLVPGLNVSGLAKDMALPARHISQVVNSRLGKNFLDFINSYRVEEAKKLLTESGANGKTILEIAYESGFNSKSVFNKAFKKHAGTAPQEFRRKCGQRAGSASISEK